MRVSKVIRSLSGAEQAKFVAEENFEEMNKGAVADGQVWPQG